MNELNEVQKTDEELIKETEKMVDNAKEEIITPKPAQKIQIVKKEEVEKILNSINGISLKFGNVIFKIKYVNIGQKRFSAECINSEI
jgi:hypothetical protein